MTTPQTPPTTRFLQVDSKRLAYVDLGRGPAVVIIHGVGGHKEDWRPIASRLSRTHRVLAVDMLGFGESSKNGEDLSMPVQAAAVRALLDSAGIAKATLVGNSVGGWVATTFAATYPERTERLILIDAAGFRAMFEGAPPVNFDPGNVAEMNALVHVVINGSLADAPGFAERAFRAYVDSGEKAISAIWGRSLFVSPRLEDLFPKLRVPTAILWGRDDRLFPSALAGAFQQQIPGAKVELIPDAGHFPHLDQPETTYAAISRALA